MATSDEVQSGPMPVSAQEEKEIRRVFDYLCDFQKKHKINQELKDLNAWVASNEAKHNAQLNAGNTLHVADEADGETRARMEELRTELHELENNPDKKISCDDVFCIMKVLNQKVTKNDVEEMVWEVDENLDGCLDYAEFRLMFNRNIVDKTGLEPSRMVSRIGSSGRKVSFLSLMWLCGAIPLIHILLMFLFILRYPNTCSSI